MIDTYADRADAASGSWRAARNHAVQQLYADPRYFNGQLYSTVIDRMAAEARYRLAVFVELRCEIEKLAMARRNRGRVS